MERLRVLGALLGDPRRRARALGVRSLRVLLRGVRSGRREQRELEMRALRPLASRFAAEIGDAGAVEALVALVASCGDNEHNKFAWKVLTALTEGDGEAGARNRKWFADAGGLELLAAEDGDEPRDSLVSSESERVAPSLTQDTEEGGSQVIEERQGEFREVPASQEAIVISSDEDEPSGVLVKREGGGAASTSSVVPENQAEQQVHCAQEERLQASDYQGNAVSLTQECAVACSGSDPNPLSFDALFRLLEQFENKASALTALLEFSMNHMSASEIADRGGATVIAHYLTAEYINGEVAKVLALKTLGNLAWLHDCRASKSSTNILLNNYATAQLMRRSPQCV